MDILTSFFATPAMAAPAAASPAGMPEENILMQLVPFIFIFVIFYFLIIRPQQKKFKQHQALISTIKRNDKVILSSGIVGKVTKEEHEGILEVEIAEGVNVKVVASTVSSVEAKEKISNDNSKKNK